jgi:hypothetical protein
MLAVNGLRAIKKIVERQRVQRFDGFYAPSARPFGGTVHGGGAGLV